MDGVSHQVGDHLDEPLEIAEDRRSALLGREVHLDRFHHRDGLEARDGGRRHVGERDLQPRQLGRARLHARQLEGAVDQLGQAQRLVGDDVEVLPDGRAQPRIVADQVGVALDPHQRGAELVRHVGEQV